MLSQTYGGVVAVKVTVAEVDAQFVFNSHGGSWSWAYFRIVNGLVITYALAVATAIVTGVIRLLRIFLSHALVTVCMASVWFVIGAG